MRPACPRAHISATIATRSSNELIVSMPNLSIPMYEPAAISSSR